MINVRRLTSSRGIGAARPCVPCGRDGAYDEADRGAGHSCGMCSVWLGLVVNDQVARVFVICLRNSNQQPKMLPSRPQHTKLRRPRLGGKWLGANHLKCSMQAADCTCTAPQLPLPLYVHLWKIGSPRSVFNSPNDPKSRIQVSLKD